MVGMSDLPINTIERIDKYNETSFTEQPSMAAEVMDYDGSEVATSSRAESSEEMSELEVELDSEDSLDGDRALEGIVQPIVAKATSQVLICCIRFFRQ